MSENSLFHTLVLVSTFDTTIVLIMIAANVFTLAYGFQIIKDVGQILSYGIQIIETYVWIMHVAILILIIGVFNAIEIL